MITDIPMCYPFSALCVCTLEHATHRRDSRGTLNSLCVLTTPSQSALPTTRCQVHSLAHASSQRHSYMASAQPRHSFACSAHTAFTAGASVSAAALSQCAAASMSSAAERGPTSQAPAPPLSTQARML